MISIIELNRVLALDLDGDPSSVVVAVLAGRLTDELPASRPRRLEDSVASNQLGPRCANTPPNHSLLGRMDRFD